MGTETTAVVTNVTKDGREKIKELRSGNVVLELFCKTGPTGKRYIDYKSSREFFVSANNDETSRGPYCQQRDIRDHIRALLDALEFISDFHREEREHND
jgi:hypothetical protein